MKRALFAVLPGILLGACSLHDDKTSARQLDRSYAMLEQPRRDVKTDAVVSYASLPAMWKAGTTTERRFGDGFTQDIRLPEYDTQNFVQLWVRKASTTLDEPIALEKPSEQSIRNELSARFPNIAMKVVETSRSNAYGPYGLAVGSMPDGMRCVYLWQWIVDPVQLQPIPNALQASVRVRICRPAITLDDLATQVSGVRLGAAVVEMIPPAKPIKPKPRVRDDVASRRPAKVSVKQAVTRAETLPPAIAGADGAPRYIVPLPGAPPSDATAQTIPLPRPMRMNDTSTLPQRSASVVEMRLNLPPEAYNARRVSAVEAKPAQLIAADPISVTGTTR